MQSSRREFTRGMAIVAAATLGGASLAFARRDRKEIEAAWALAREHGRPLIVFVTRGDHGRGLDVTFARVLTEYFRGADEKRLVDLSKVDAVCASLDDIKSVIGVAAATALSRVRGSAALIVCRCDADAKLVSVLDTSAADVEAARGDAFASFDLEAPPSIRAFATQIDSFLRSELGTIEPPTEESEQRRAAVAAAVRTALGADELKLLEAAKSDVSTISDELVRRASAFLIERAREWKPEARKTLETRLATAARARFLDAAPVGAAWVRRGGCGSKRLPDGRTIQGFVCGTGMLNPSQTRFIYYLTRKDREEMAGK